MNEAENKKAAYDFYGKMPFRKAFPLGLQHVLAMFVANVTPVMLIASVAVYNGQAFTAIDTARAIVTARRQGRSRELQAIDVTKL